MRFAAHTTPTGRRLAVVVDDGLVDLDDLGLPFASFAQLWSAWPDCREIIAAGIARGVEPHPLGEATLLPPMDDSATLWAAAANYLEHIREGNFTRPDFPPFFLRHSRSIVGHGGDVRKPWFSDVFDYEGELAIVIGRPARFVPEERALEYVAGYACFNDGSVRDWQRHTTQITVGKNFLHSGAFGPWVTTADEVPDIENRILTTRLNGTVVQSSPVGAAIWGIAYVVSYLSAVTELVPGDVIALGTPAGVGARQKPPRFLRAGDRVVISIDGVGALTHGVVETPALARPWPSGVK